MLGVGSRKLGRSAVHDELASKLVKTSGLKSLTYDVMGDAKHCVVTPTTVDGYSSLFAVVRKNADFTMRALPEQYRTVTNRAGYGVTISGETAVFVVLCPVDAR